MYARVTTTVLGADEDDASGAVFEQVLPAIQELSGFRGMVILSELDGGRRVVAMTLWESLAALEDAGAAMDKLRDAESTFRSVDEQETARFMVSGSELAS